MKTRTLLSILLTSTIIASGSSICGAAAATTKSQIPKALWIVIKDTQINTATKIEMNGVTYVVVKTGRTTANVSINGSMPIDVSVHYNAKKTPTNKAAPLWGTHRTK